MLPAPRWCVPTTSARLSSPLRPTCSLQFFLLSNALEGSDEHLIEPAALKRIWAVAEDLFDAPLEAKRAVAVATSDNNRGYFSANDHREINKDPNGVCLADSKEVRVSRA